MEKLLCGVDIGGTKCSVALVNHEGKIIDRNDTCNHVTQHEEGLVELVAAHIKQLISHNKLQETDIEGIGIGCAGHIRYRDGVIITTSNLNGFKNYPLRNAFQAHFNIPVMLDNDANAQAFGEFKFGYGKGRDSMVFLTISTGIGAGIIINHQLYRGHTGTAGEFGHTIVEPGSQLTCSCGNNGCLMACACGMALPFLFQQKINQGKHSNLNLPPSFNINKVSGQLLKKGLEANDPVSTEIVLESGYYVGVGIYNIFQALNPELIVIGGGLLGWGNFYVGKVRETFVALARDMIFDPVEIKVTEIGPDAGVIGAASLAVSHA